MGNAQLCPETLDNSDRIVRLLRAGFPNQPASVWENGFKRLAGTHMADSPIATILSIGGQDKGVILSLQSKRELGNGQNKMVNLSGWYIEESARMHSVWMLKKVSGEPNAIFTDLTAEKEVERLSLMLKFAAVTACTTWCNLLALAAGNTRARILNYEQTIASPGAAPIAAALTDHHRWGCLVCSLQVDDKVWPLVFRKRVFGRALTGYGLLFAENIQMLFDHMPVIARHLLSKGRAILEIDPPCKPPKKFGYHVWSNKKRLAKGPYPDGRVDFLYSELSLFDFRPMRAAAAT